MNLDAKGITSLKAECQVTLDICEVKISLNHGMLLYWKQLLLLIIFSALDKVHLFWWEQVY